MGIKHYHLDYHSIDYDRLKPDAIQIAIPIHLLADDYSIPIDSTGVKRMPGPFTLTSEMVKHLKEAYFEAYAEAPSATDAVVDVELYNVTDGAVVTKVTYSGDSGLKVSSDIAATLKTLTGKVLAARINVTTASATAGATQLIRSIVLRLVLGVS